MRVDSSTLLEHVELVSAAAAERSSCFDGMTAQLLVVGSAYCHTRGLLSSGPA